MNNYYYSRNIYLFQSKQHIFNYFSKYLYFLIQFFVNSSTNGSIIQLLLVCYIFGKFANKKGKSYLSSLFLIIPNQEHTIFNTIITGTQFPFPSKSTHGFLFGVFLHTKTSPFCSVCFPPFFWSVHGYHNEKAYFYGHLISEFLKETTVLKLKLDSYYTTVNAIKLLIVLN